MKIVILFAFMFFIGFACAANISIDDANVALSESYDIINELSSQGFSITSVNDSYSEALLVFQQVNYAEILRNKSISDSDPLKIEAKNALGFVNWKNLTYSDVIYYTDAIKTYRENSYYIFDSIIALSKKIENYVGQGINVSKSESLLELVNQSFYNGQIDESLSYVEQTKVQIESDFESASSLNVLAENAKNFFVRYIYWIIFLVVLFAIMGYFISGYIRLNLLRRKIAKLETEEKVLDGLMRKTQVERYKENKISGLIYNIRMKKYQERLSEIKQDLPVLKKRLHR